MSIIRFSMSTSHQGSPILKIIQASSICQISTPTPKYKNNVILTLLDIFFLVDWILILTCIQCWIFWISNATFKLIGLLWKFNFNINSNRKSLWYSNFFILRWKRKKTIKLKFYRNNTLQKVFVVLLYRPMVRSYGGLKIRRQT